VTGNGEKEQGRIGEKEMGRMGKEVGKVMNNV
jgi:hypothetical protein